MRDYAGDEKLSAVPDDAAVTAAVGIRPRSDGGLGLTVRLAVAVPGLHRAVAEKIVERGHVTSPFFHAMRSNIAVRRSSSGPVRPKMRNN